MCRLLAFPKSDLASGGQRDLVDLVEMGLQVSRRALGAGPFCCQLQCAYDFNAVFAGSIVALRFG
jgi:hypothetical protein